MIHRCIAAVLLLGMLFGSAPEGLGLSMAPELPRLASDSEFVFTGKVVGRTDLGQHGSSTFIKASITPDRLFKGKIAPGSPVVFYTLESRKGSSGLEDPVPSFPATGARVLLFLKREAHGKLVPVSPSESVFRILDGGALLPFSLFSLSQVEDFFTADKRKAPEPSSHPSPGKDK